MPWGYLASLMVRMRRNKFFSQNIFVSGDQIQKNFLTQKEQQIKMSSVMNVSNNASRKPEEFSLKDIEVDSKKQNWFKRAHIRQYLGIACIVTSTAKLSEEDIRSWTFPKAKGVSIVWTPLGKTLRIMIFSSHLLVHFMSL